RDNCESRGGRSRLGDRRPRPPLPRLQGPPSRRQGPAPPVRQRLPQRRGRAAGGRVARQGLREGRDLDRAGRRGRLTPNRLRLMARRRLKLIFGTDLVKEPVIYQLGRKFEIVTNIRRADVTGDAGWVILEVTGEPDELDKGVEYLESRGVRVKPAEGDLVG